MVPRAPCVDEPPEELELGRESAVAEDNHLECTCGLRDRDAGLDLVEAAGVTEAAAGTTDDDVEASALVLHSERLDQRHRLGSNANRLVKAAGQHVEAALIRQRSRARCGLGSHG